MPIIKKTLLIKNKLGLHARAATQLVQLSQNFSSKVVITYGEKSANANSVMALLMLAGATGNQVEVSCEGEDAEQALIAVEELFNAKFNEESI
ncbi:HPr family phosphocarrier protein [Catenovulum maritimum]|uniref:Phosphate ABC transporter permease n=1 Tax=Catenovulum maritimum TaxID=1513271 RepID=A0A0J8GQH4_9ALTE|nr:HPr family phosphocarrier protein [Catenovulum maritimum]KMT65015.1 phosphate ABC transporter permease [Catenovulum maritimum]